jgi:hypothetical protein
MISPKHFKLLSQSRAGHSAYKFPLQISFGNCPGWTAAGARIPACWNGDVLTTACRAEWRTFAPTLQTANLARGVDVAF